MKPVATNINGLANTPGALDSTRSNIAKSNTGADAIFRNQLEALRNTQPSTATVPKAGGAAVPGLKFSNHAIDRMQARGIRFSPEQMTKIENAVSKAAGKGAKDTLLLTDESALIVNVKDKTVVTVMDKANLKENVFTNIDSTVMI